MLHDAFDDALDDDGDDENLPDFDRRVPYTNAELPFVVAFAGLSGAFHMALLLGLLHYFVGWSPPLGVAVLLVGGAGAAAAVLRFTPLWGPIARIERGILSVCRSWI